MRRTASVTKASANRKLTADKRARPVSVSRAAQESCPSSCPFFGKGCYAESGPSGIHSGRLNVVASEAGATALEIAREESRAIVSEWPRDGRPLRLHEVGDCKTPGAAAAVAVGVAESQAHGAGAAWTYTHAWKDVPRASWGPVSVLASVETPGEALAARSQGYAPAIVSETPEAGVALLGSIGVRGVHCPQETGAAPDCASCGLCMRADRLLEVGAGIIFTPHGSGKRRVLETVQAKVAADETKRAA